MDGAATQLRHIFFWEGGQVLAGPGRDCHHVVAPALLGSLEPVAPVALARFAAQKAVANTSAGDCSSHAY